MNAELHDLYESREQVVCYNSKTLESGEPSASRDAGTGLQRTLYS